MTQDTRESELRELAEACGADDWNISSTSLGDLGRAHTKIAAECVYDRHAQFIAAANPQTVLALLSELDTLREENGKLRAELEARPAWKENPPEDGRIILGGWSMRFKHYKPSGRKQMGRKGRWQQSNGYGGWENCREAPVYWLSESPDRTALKGEEG